MSRSAVREKKRTADHADGADATDIVARGTPRIQTERKIPDDARHRPVIVAVTEIEYAKARDVFEAAGNDGFDCRSVPGPEAALVEAAMDVGARHVILGLEHYAGPLYDTLPAGGVLARFGVGFDGLNLPRATSSGLLCTNTPGVLDQSVAEHTIALIMAAARNLGRMRKGWNPTMGVELAGRTLAVIGCGAIGCRVAGMASRGFGMRVVGCEVRAVDKAALKTAHGFSDVVGNFDNAVAGADFVSLHMPVVPGTRGFVDGNRMSQMRREAWLINTARGALVDEAALFDALAAGTIRGAALDVFCREPYEPVQRDKDLRMLPNAILTPHVGSTTVEACRRMAKRALRNVALGERREYAAMDLLNGEVLREVMNS